MFKATQLHDFSTCSVTELLAMHTAVLAELNRRQVVRSANNPTGDYTEWLVSTKLGLKLAAQSAKGYDALDSDGIRYQIKGRRLTKLSGPVQLGVLRGLSQKSFDFLIAVSFTPSWEVRHAAKIPYEVVLKLGTFREHVNGHVMHLRPTIFEDPKVIDITELLR